MAVMTLKIDGKTVREAVEKQEDSIFSNLSELVAFNSPRGEEGNRKAAEWVKAAFEKFGVAMEAHETSDGTLALVGTREGDADAPEVLLYSHYDVVPAGDLDKWESDPFTLTKRGDRWYGRGAADCKGNIAAHLAVLEAVEKLGGTRANLRIVIEGSEEVGGEGLDNLIETNPELFKADVICIVDAGNAKAGVPTLTSSLRGGGQMDITITTMASPAHSGEFGGPAEFAGVGGGGHRCDGDVHLAAATQAGGQGGHAGLGVAGIDDADDVGLEQLRVGFDEVVEALAADFLRTLDDDAEVGARSSQLFDGL